MNVKQIIYKYYLTIFVIIIILVCLLLSVFNLNSIINWILLVSSAVVGLRIFVKMILKFKKGQYGVDLLAIIAIASTIMAKEYWAAIVIALMLTGGEALEEYATSRAKRELTDLLARAPRFAHVVKDDGTTEEVAINNIKINEKLVVLKDEVVPVDSILNDSIAELDESSITGESMPVEHKFNDELLSGSVATGRINITASKTAKNSEYQKIIKLVKAASTTDSTFIRMADKFSIPFTAISILIASLAWVFSKNPMRFAEVLVLATPCPLLIATPIALISGMSRAAKSGIIVKSGVILEKLAQIKSVAFDKTGTLTNGIPDINGINPEAGTNDIKLITYAASVEENSLHPLATVLLNEAKKRHIELLPTKNLNEEVGKGIVSEVYNDKVIIGKSAFLSENNIKLPLLKNDFPSIYVAINGKYAGYISFVDQLRPEAKSTIVHLNSLNIKNVVVLTGDSKKVADQIAKQIGISQDKVFAGLLPEMKVGIIRKLVPKPVMMVGDGVNDAPVIEAASVGVAMGSRKSTVASESADVVILVDNLSRSWQAIFIARRTMNIAKQGILIGIGLSVVLMLIAAFSGLIPAILGAILQEIVDVAVILNALRAHRISIR